MKFFQIIDKGLDFRSPIYLVVILILFAGAVAIQWQGPQSIASSDGIAYITGGLNLIRGGCYFNPAGEPELWFPPLYPIMIGVLSLGGRIEPLFIARMISVISGVLTMILVWRVCLCRSFLSPWCALFACLSLACNSLFQLRSNAPMSESPATLFSFCAFYIWDRLSESKSDAKGYWVSWVGIGLFVGLTYLIRPEGILLFPLMVCIDAWYRKNLHAISGYAISAAVLVFVISPYLAYLHSHTGRFALSNKTEVNLAQGYSNYYLKSQFKRESIDPVTYRMVYYKPDVTARSEIRRYLFNLARVGRGYSSIYHSALGGGILIAALTGMYHFWRSKNRRFFIGLSALFAYIPCMAIFTVTPRYLHATLPAISIFIGMGLWIWIQRCFFFEEVRSGLKLGLAALLLWAGLGLSEGYIRYPRWRLHGWENEKTILRDAGCRFSSLGFPRGTMFGAGDTIAYYAGQFSRRLTRDDLVTITAYIRQTQDGPVYLSLSTLDSSLHGSVYELLETDSPPFESVMNIQDSRGRVVIYRIK